MPWPWRHDSLEKRIARFVNDAAKWIESAWPKADGPAGYAGQQQHLQAVFRKLESGWPPDELPALAADVFFHPTLWFESEPTCSGRIQHLLWVYLASNPPKDIVSRIEGRMRHLLEHPCDAEIPSRQRMQRMYTSSPMHFYIPDMRSCLQLLAHLQPTPQVLELIHRIVLGRFNEQPVSAPCFIRSKELWGSFIVCAGSPNLAGFERPWTAYPYEIWYSDLSLEFPELMKRLCDHGLLPFETFRSAAIHLPLILTDASRGYRSELSDSSHWPNLGKEFIRVLQEYCERIAWEACQRLDDRTILILSSMERYRGSRFLLQAAQLHSRLGLGKLVYDGHQHRRTPEAVIVRLARTEYTEPTEEEERRGLVVALRKSPPETLKRLLPVTTRSRSILLEALRWEDARPLVQLLIGIAGLDRARPSWEHTRQSSPDPSVGVIDVAAARNALEAVGTKRAREILTLFREAKVYADIAVTLVETVAGLNRKDIETRVVKRNQLAVRAYGLLPIIRGDDEVLERYLFLKAFALESRKFGMMRQGNEKAAAQAGMENLARNAGYGDSTRLEWAMEARLGGTVIPGRRWSIGGYELEICVSGTRADVVTRKDGRQLKSIPTCVRKEREYTEIKDTLKQLRNQASRIRATLERIMTEGDTLRGEEVERLLQLPMARFIVTSLVWGTEDRSFGLLDGDSKQLVDPSGSSFLMPERVFIAHPYHLFRAGVLGRWQQRVVHLRIEQPFKQVFRELYVITPAEEQTQIFSNRFAGRLLNSGVASRLFQAREWKFEPGDVAIPYKVFPKHGLRAVFDFPDAGHILAETESVTSDRVYFENQGRPIGILVMEGDWIELKKIPPLVFSEVMRDADLVVSVAQRGQSILSDEAFQRRGEVVKTLLEDLGLHGVTIEGHHAKVRGKLANYSVHLGTAHIFIEPGNYLCVVPDRWGKNHENLFLPFADEGDRKYSEVISKILFLVNDYKIKDASILGQIRQKGMGALPLHR